MLKPLFPLFADATCFIYSIHESMSVWAWVRAWVWVWACASELDALFLLIAHATCFIHYLNVSGCGYAPMRFCVLELVQCACALWFLCFAYIRSQKCYFRTTYWWTRSNLETDARADHQNAFDRLENDQACSFVPYTISASFVSSFFLEVNFLFPSPIPDSFSASLLTCFFLGVIFLFSSPISDSFSDIPRLF